jgi:exopolysaccharide biosynthesis polyprenyl glycosylphosphotransferase
VRVRGLRIGLLLSERRLLLLVLDLGAVGLAVLIGFALWNQRAGVEAPVTETVRQSLELAIGLLTLWLVPALVAGLYDLRVAAHRGQVFPRLFGVGLVQLIGYLGLYFAAPPLSLPRFFFLVWLGAELGLVGLWRWTYATWLTGPHFRRRVLVVGAGWAGRTVAEALKSEPSRVYEPVGLLDDDPTKHGQVVGGLRVLGPAAALPAYVQRLGIDDVVVAITNGLSPRTFQALVECQGLGVNIQPMPLFYERLTGRVPVEHVGPNWILVTPVNRPPGKLWLLTKRSVDILLALVGLVVLGLVLPFVALAIYLDNPGPIFYYQTRCGQAGRPYRMVKFRSMVVEAEAEGRPVWAQTGDPRVTRVGRVLRRTRLDELPQVLNVLRGEMSIVGPRPERPEFVQALEQQIPFYRARLAVRPGLTGWAQVHYGYGRTVEDALVKLQYDLYYIKHQGLWLDLQVLARTVLTVLTRPGS